MLANFCGVSMFTEADFEQPMVLELVCKFPKNLTISSQKTLELSPKSHTLFVCLINFPRVLAVFFIRSCLRYCNRGYEMLRNLPIVAKPSGRGDKVCTRSL